MAIYHPLQALVHNTVTMTYNKNDEATKAMRKEHLENLRETIKESPEVLACFGRLNQGGRLSQHTYPTPLAEAVLSHNLGAAEVLLEAFNNRDYADKILTQLQTEKRIAEECPHKNPLYMRVANSTADSNTGHFPHYYITDPDMLELFHKHGYDLNKVNRYYQKDGFYVRMINDLDTFIGASYEGHYMQQAIDARALLRRAAAIGVPGPEVYEEKLLMGTHKHPMSVGEFAYRKFCESLALQRFGTLEADENKFPTQMQRAIEEMKFLLRSGIDCRTIFAENFKVDPQSFFKPEDEKDIFSKIRGDLQILINEKLDHYFDTPDPQKRKDDVLIACAGGAFLSLLHRCAQRDGQTGDGKEVPALIDHLSEPWKKEYRNIVDVTIPRISPLTKEAENSALKRYLKSNAVPLNRT